MPSFFDLTGIEVFDVGKWNGFEYSDEDLDEMCVNFDALSKMGYDFPAKLSHDPEQRLISNSELPAAAYISRLYRSGSKLVADFTQVPELVKDLIDLQAYRTVSAEIYPAVQLMGKTWKNVVGAVAFLGGEIPAVGTLKDIKAMYAHAKPLTWPTDAKAVLASYTPAPKTRVVKEGSVAKQRSFGTRVRDALARVAGVRTHDLGSDVSIDDRIQTIEGLLEALWPGSWVYVDEMFDAYVIAERDSAFFQVPYAVAADSTVTLGEPIVEVEHTWREKTAPITNAPIADTKNAGKPGKEDDMAITKNLATALGLPENAEEPAVLKAIGDLKGTSEKFAATSTELTELREEVRKLTAENATTKAAASVDAAINANKILPAQREWALSYAAKDPDGFATFVKAAAEQVDTTEHGSAGDAPASKSDVATFRTKVAEKVKAGMPIADAQNAVAVEEPALFAAVYGRR